MTARSASPEEELLREFLDLCPRMSDDDMMAPAIADVCKRARLALSHPAAASQSNEKRCGLCHKCLEGQTVDWGNGVSMPVTAARMILCEICGNKRCPHATDCALACTNSNDPGQPGSVYTSQANAAAEDGYSLSGREWFVIEDSMKNGVFASDAQREFKRYIPRDVAESLLGRDLSGTQFFSRDESERLRAHPECVESLPPPPAPLARVEEIAARLQQYQQTDQDGIMVLVSRQACDEAASALRSLLAPDAREKTECICPKCGIRHGGSNVGAGF